MRLAFFTRKRGSHMKARSFEEWMREVNAALLALCGMCADDLPDWRYADDWREGVNPGRSARRAIRYAKDL